MYFSHDSGHEPDIVVATRPVGAVQVGAGGLRQESRSRECCDDGDVGNPCWRGFGFILVRVGQLSTPAPCI